MGLVKNDWDFHAWQWDDRESAPQEAAWSSHDESRDISHETYNCVLVSCKTQEV